MKPTSVSRKKKFPFAHKQHLQWSSRASSSLRTFHASSSTPPPVFNYRSLNFSSAVQSLRCSVSMEEMQAKLSRREKAANIMPYLDIDIFMKVLGFEVYTVTVVGDQML
ncbi:pleiotropic drug resistance protein 1-like isoform X2 [Quercus robur]|uniref:pleiotropic drug resistance protein 1-like isoform X2 n=1 Tax=Quercus robur TaxID=38942 RepID=UPI002163B3ED|nr:pleiotropic drug resistance protein 1-like isoform X2 [Quercus robur]XP_050284868.1 pleiotropic drug resistance protein 1-like isoform X2 [Quercus robur]